MATKINTLSNPFVISGYEGPAYFCDREEETRRLTEHLTNGSNVTLISPRRMGKTGLILHAFGRIKKSDPSVATIYVDLLPTESLADLTRALAIAVMEQMDSSWENMLKKVAGVFSRLRPTVSVDPATGTPKVSVDLAPQEEMATLEQVFTYLKDCGKECFVALDEFQQVACYPEKNTEAFLRSHIQFLNNVHFIFSGSSAHMLAEMFHSPKRPFFNSTSFCYIGPIKFEEYYGFASTFFQKAGRVLDQETFHTLYSRFEGHTWYIQKILNKIFSQEGAKTVDIRAIERALQDIQLENEYYYQMVLRAYAKGQVKLLKAVAREGRVTEILSGSFISKYDLSATSSVRGALKRLLDDELIYRDAHGYLVYDRFFAEWLRNLQ